MLYAIKRNDGCYAKYDDYRHITYSKGLSNALKGEKSKIHNVFINNLSASQRANCSIVELNESIEFSGAPQQVHVDTTISDITTIISKIDYTKLKAYKTMMQSQYDNITNEICDINHYIEFNDFDACKGYKAYKMLKDKLNERRIIKDNLTYIDIITSCTVQEIMDGTYTKRIVGMEERKYIPRVLTELFN